MDKDERPLIERAKKDAGKDRALADEAKLQSDVAALHALSVRLIADRTQLAEAFDAVCRGWTMLGDEASHQHHPDSVASIERIATEAIQFAREVVQAMKQQPK